jgi:hypothetical protein
MRTRSNRDVRRLKSVMVKDGGTQHAGALLFETSDFIVLLNNMIDTTDVGPLRLVRSEHIEPECDVLVLPRTPSMSVKILD